MVLSQATLASLTGVELFTALAQVGLSRARLELALAAITDPDGDPALALQGLRFLQAAALVLALRSHPDPAPTWEEAQEWSVTADMTDPGEDPLTAERREYRVAAALVTGLPGEEAEGLPVAEVAAFAEARRRLAGVE